MPGLDWKMGLEIDNWWLKLQMWKCAPLLPGSKSSRGNLKGKIRHCLFQSNPHGLQCTYASAWSNLRSIFYTFSLVYRDWSRVWSYVDFNTWNLNPEWQLTRCWLVDDWLLLMVLSPRDEVTKPKLLCHHITFFRVIGAQGEWVLTGGSILISRPVNQCFLIRGFQSLDVNVGVFFTYIYSENSFRVMRDSSARPFVRVSKRPSHLNFYRQLQWNFVEKFCRRCP